MSLTNDKRQEFKDFLRTVNRLDALIFLAEYCAEHLVVISESTSETIAVRNRIITLFEEEIISQVNERI